MSLSITAMLSFWCCLLIFLSADYVAAIGIKGSEVESLLPRSSQSTESDTISVPLFHHQETTREEDEYRCTYITLPMKKEMTIVGFQKLVDSTQVHHMLIYACDCLPPVRTEASYACKHMPCPCATRNNRMVYGDHALPKGVGFRVGGETNVKVLVLQAHYREKVSLDSSGFYIQMTSSPRALFANIFATANSDAHIPKNVNDTNVQFDCDLNNIQSVLYPFAYRVHAHSTCFEISGTHFFGNATLDEIKNRSSFTDLIEPAATTTTTTATTIHNERKRELKISEDSTTIEELLGRRSPGLPQIFVPINNSYSITNKDSIHIECHYNTVGKDKDIAMGYKHTDEMCNFYLMYFSTSDTTIMCSSAGVNEVSNAFENQKGFLDQNSQRIEENNGLVNSSSINWKENLFYSGSFSKLFEYDVAVTWWSDHFPLVNQVTGVALHNTGGTEYAYILHRGTRKWDQNTFTEKDNKPISNLSLYEEDVAFKVELLSRKIVASFGSNLFMLPHSIEIDKNSDIWISDVAAHSVCKLDAVTYKKILCLRSKNGRAEPDKQVDFCQPAGIKTSGDFVYVADGYCGSRVARFTLSGEWDTNYNIENGHVVHDISIDEDTNTLYVANREMRKVTSFNLTSGEILKDTSFSLKPFALDFVSDLGLLALFVDEDAFNTDVHLIESSSSVLSRSSLKRGDEIPSLLSHIIPSNFLLRPRYGHSISASKDGCYIAVAELWPPRVSMFIKRNCSFPVDDNPEENNNESDEKTEPEKTEPEKTEPGKITELIEQPTIPTPTKQSTDTEISLHETKNQPTPTPVNQDGILSNGTTDDDNVNDNKLRNNTSLDENNNHTTSDEDINVTKNDEFSHNTSFHEINSDDTTFDEETNLTGNGTGHRKKHRLPHSTMTPTSAAILCISFFSVILIVYLAVQINQHCPLGDVHSRGDRDRYGDDYNYAGGANYEMVPLEERSSESLMGEFDEDEDSEAELNL